MDRSEGEGIRRMDIGEDRELDRQCAAADGFVVHIVDDDDGFRTSLLRLFRSKNIQAAGYATLTQFERADSDGAPGCVLLDLCMPDGDGMAMFARLMGEDSFDIPLWGD